MLLPELKIYIKTTLKLTDTCKYMKCIEIHLKIFS